MLHFPTPRRIVFDFGKSCYPRSNSSNLDSSLIVLQAWPPKRSKAFCLVASLESNARCPEIKPREYGRPSRKVHFQLKATTGSVFAAAGAVAGRSPGWASERKQRAQPGERPAAASAPAKPLAAAVLSSKRPFSEGRPYCLGLISGYLGS